MYRIKAKLRGNIESDGANGILSNTIFAVPLKYLSHFSRSLVMLLINNGVELKLDKTLYFVWHWC